MEIYTCDGTRLTPGVQLERRHDGDPAATPRFVRLGGPGPGSRPQYLTVHGAPRGGLLLAAGVAYRGTTGRPSLGAPPRGPLREVLVCLRLPYDHAGSDAVTGPDQELVPCPLQGRQEARAGAGCDLCGVVCPDALHPPTGSVYRYRSLKQTSGVTVLGHSYRPYRAPPGLRHSRSGGVDEALLVLGRNAAVRLRPYNGAFNTLPAGILHWDGRDLGLQHSFGGQLEAA